MRSIGFRFLIVGLLTLLMFIPLFLAGAVIDSRAEYSRSTIWSVGNEWGGEQLISGPQIVIPVEGPVTRIESRKLPGREGAEARFEDVEVTEIQRKAPVYLYPDDFRLRIASKTQERARGIFTVPVYVADASITAEFDFSNVPDLLQQGERPLWTEAELRVTLRSNTSLRGAANLTAGGQALSLEPLTAQNQAGIVARLGDPRETTDYMLELGFNGAESFLVTPVGRTSKVSMESDWPHPSFTGAFLPNTHTVTENGFEAEWLIPHLARSLSQAARTDFDPVARSTTGFGVRYFRPNDFYQKAYRAARYGILFIALTFLTVLLIEDRTARPTHPVQYIFIGLAQSIFVLLMVAYAEQIGFEPAYLLSSGATILLLVMFGALGLKLGKRTLVLGVMLLLLYAVLYLILRSADYALLAGATVSFAALAGTMYLTRNEDWYGTPGERKVGWFGRKKTEKPSVTPDGA